MGLKWDDPLFNLDISPQEFERQLRERAKAEKRAKIEAKKVRRAEREAELGRKQREREPGKFGVILADADSDRQAIVSIATKDCVLLVRCKGPNTLQALELIESCGVKYKTNFVRYLDQPDDLDPSLPFQNVHEVMLLNTRGKFVAPAPGTQSSSFIDHVPFIDVINAYFPSLAIKDMTKKTRKTTRP